MSRIVGWLLRPLIRAIAEEVAQARETQVSREAPGAVDEFTAQKLPAPTGAEQEPYVKTVPASSNAAMRPHEALSTPAVDPRGVYELWEVGAMTPYKGTRRIRPGLTTVADLVEDLLQGEDPGDYFIKLNGHPVAADELVKPGDRLSLIPTVRNNFDSGDLHPVRVEIAEDEDYDDDDDDDYDDEYDGT